MAEAFEALSDEILEALRKDITKTMAQDLYNALLVLHANTFTSAVYVDVLIEYLKTRVAWLPKNVRRDTQKRFLRRVRDAAVYLYSLPVCTGNNGYWYGDKAALLKTARRARRYAEGALVRATLVEALAARL